MFLATLYHFLSKGSVGLGALPCRVVFRYRKPKTRSFGNLDRTRNDNVEYYLIEKASHLVRNLFRQGRTSVIHRQKNAEYIQTRIKVSLNPLHRIKKLRNTLESVELTLDGDEQLIGSNKGIDRQETQ